MQIMTNQQARKEAEQEAEPVKASNMRAVTQRAYGSADVLSMETIDRPVIAADEVLIEVVAAGLDRGVWHLMTGTALPHSDHGLRLHQAEESRCPAWTSPAASSRSDAT